MGTKHENYGTYYGELISALDNSDKLDDFYFDCERGSRVREVLLEMGLVEAFFDVDNDHADTLFFKVDEKTKMNKLMVWVATQCPHEFSEESPNHFRMWFD